MNPILHDLQNKRWIWTAANAKQQAPGTTLATGFESLDKVLSGGFPRAGMIHLQSPLGCGEMRFMLSVLQHQHSAKSEHKLYMFIDPPFELNAEFLLAQQVSLSQLVVVRTTQQKDALWSAEQCAKSGACHAIFMWQQHLKHIQVRKIEHAAQQGNCYCIWLHSYMTCGQQNLPSAEQSNLPLSLSLSITRQANTLGIKVNKQKVGWAQKAVKVPLPFNSRTNGSLQQQLKQRSLNDTNKVVPIHANR
jgi:hypothetical protein